MTQSDDKFRWKDGVSLKEYVDLRFAENLRSIELATKTMDRRLEGMNEFREQLNKQAAQFVSRSELDLRIKPIEGALKSLELTRATVEGKASQTSVFLAYLLSVIGLVLGAIGLFR